MKKILCGAISAVMLFAGAAVVNAEPTFSDLDTAKWAEPYILEMAEMGFISGYSGGLFKPDNDVTHLEGLVLFSRAMGSNSEAMEEILKYAVKEYGDIVDDYNLAFGKNEVCFMLYRKALTVDELDDYIAKSVVNTPMKRYEAAMVITKAMAAEKEAKAELLLDLTYDDTKTIPAKATKYVYYVTENGIMNGVSGNLFSPNTNVKRSQIAVMLWRAVEAMGTSFIETTLKEVDTADATVVTSDGTFTYSSNTTMYSEGKIAAASTMPKNVKSLLVIVDDELVFLDALSSQADETVQGVFYEYFSNNDVLNIKVKPTGSGTSQYYECIKGLKVTRNGTSSSIIRFEEGDFVTLTIKDGVVTEISAEEKTEEIEDAVIEQINIEEGLTIVISHDDPEFDGMELSISNDVSVVKNSAKSDLSKIYRGDRVTLTLEYGQVAKIVAKSSKSTYEGTIREIHISALPYMIVSINGKEAKYDIPSSANIKVNGEAGTLYDFRLGDTVKITLESQAITAINAISSQSTSHSITGGTVTATNSSYGFIKVSYDENGVTREETVMCKDASTTVMGADGKASSLKNVEVGNIVTIRGKLDNGAFVASLIIIEAE